ncbi:hypothetical protein SARC_01143 [Sphaeroforma arctica JP610]|uniref:Bms1-type G domain-containing protein n=1 Tax=Sphaeroforma arctica JP610 TaxID=667725 RepID=A0A0L0GEP2_9EUKA|nr:hypothetical protein SARC_01143 [Sphaeroforma arctica JP610]KNC86723.1 hypothetical protein SARC_01143 [Sphaeroforma arctica JP610]|eukprot:XP_014160625.1 hypothetical protein SARC_01143 [Sphaeroforma arctica JP610]
MEHSHRSGALKQANKGHKFGKHSSKRSRAEESKGRLALNSKHDKNGKHEASKLDRRNRAKQIRAQKRVAVLSAKRLIGGMSGASQLIALIPVCDGAQSSHVKDRLLGVAKEEDVDSADAVVSAFGAMSTCSSRTLKNRFTFIDVDRTNTLSVMEAVKMADTVVFVAACDSAPDEAGEIAITCAKAIGLPPMVSVVLGLERMPVKRRGEVKKAVHKYLQFHFPADERILPCDTTTDALALLRALATKKRDTVDWRSKRAYVVPDKVGFVHNEEMNGGADNGTLKLTGYIRGSKLDANRLVHIPGGGDFQIQKVVRAANPHTEFDLKKDNRTDVEMGDDDEDMLAVPDALKKDTLVSELEPDMMDQEQTFPTEEEELEAERTFEMPKVVKRVPKGTSAYQAAWIVEEENDSDETDAELTDMDDDMDDVEMNEDFYNPQANKKVHNNNISVAKSAPLTLSMLEGLANGDAGAGVSRVKVDSAEEFEDVEGEETQQQMFEKYDKGMDYEKEQEMYEDMVRERHLALAEQENDDLEFPDEIDTPVDQPAHIRFQKFRGLQSFKDSKWDPKESLPLDYSRIFQFDDFKRTHKRVRVEAQKNGIAPGQYVTVYISNVPAEFGRQLANPSEQHSKVPVVMTNLLRHEGKMTVVNFTIKRHSTNERVVKNKADLVYVTPLRTFTASTVFSQHTRGDKFKMERFLHASRPIVASVYAPVHFGHLPTVVFERIAGSNTLKLLALGSVSSVNADRVNLKKIVLSGAPYKINIRHATVRYMFFNTRDIAWFKSVELWTKGGLRGHIKETLGTHGHMKCSFNGAMRAEDTVCMSLYKRAYPKWNYCDGVRDADVIDEDISM